MKIIWIHHSHGKTLNTVLFGSEQVAVESSEISKAFWELSERYPDALMMWVDDELKLSIKKDYDQLFTHQNVMVSYAIKSNTISDKIGYIDQLPFVNPDRLVKYPSWRMSTDIGGIWGGTASKFKKLLAKIDDFGYLINSIAKVGQQNGLFCYHTPQLVGEGHIRIADIKMDDQKLFDFVSQHYKKPRLLLLFFCFLKYERKFFLGRFLQALFKSSYFKKSISLSQETIQSSTKSNPDKSIDIIIPTLGRSKYIRDLMQDINSQSLLPKKVIIVEQNPDISSLTKLQFLKEIDWSFEMIHLFIHKTGACNARNLALKEVTSAYVFFADDDIRFSSELLEKAISEVNRLGVGCLNLNCILPEAKTIFPKIKQWGAFGSGTSVVRSEFALKCKFSEYFEHGFGEDIDYGMQLRSKACDIVYHPEITTIHYKAEEGGFRALAKDLWTKDSLEPKPSPTMMVLVKLYYTRFMERGYKSELFGRFYQGQSIRNPFTYIKIMRKKWNLSERLAYNLLINSED